MAMTRTTTGRSGTPAPRRTADARLHREGRSRMQWSPRHRSVGNALVAAQFGLVGVCLLPVGPTLGTGQLRWLGLACLALAAVVGGLALLALGRDTRVHPIPAESAWLHTGGIYSVIRHPMYAAVLLACTGVTLATGRVLSLVALLLLSAVLHVKARFEDRLLSQAFGWQFAVYAQRVPALVPQPWRGRNR